MYGNIPYTNCEDNDMPALATERCDLRLVPDDKKLLSIAATISGLTMTSFIRNVAIEAAKDVISKNNVIEFTTRCPRQTFQTEPCIKESLGFGCQHS